MYNIYTAQVPPGLKRGTDTCIDPRTLESHNFDTMSQRNVRVFVLVQRPATPLTRKTQSRMALYRKNGRHRIWHRGSPWQREHQGAVMVYRTGRLRHIGIAFKGRLGS